MSSSTELVPPESEAVFNRCPVHPEDDCHECMAGEMKCVYCGVRLHPYPCKGCGRFLTAREMHTNLGDSNRCNRCA
jgi:hypothetical protein